MVFPFFINISLPPASSDIYQYWLWKEDVFESELSYKQFLNELLPKTGRQYVHVTLMGYNVTQKSKKEIKDFTEYLKTDLKIASISIDQESNPRVLRLKGPDFYMPPEYIESTKQAHDIGVRIGKDLHDIGIDRDFAPVVDVLNVCTNTQHVLEGRTLSADPNKVVTYATAFCQGMLSMGVGVTLKHAPGHGGSDEIDPHTGITHVRKSAEELTKDWNVFIKILKRLMRTNKKDFDAGKIAIMVGHQICDAWDPMLPASLSPVVIAKMKKSLRHALGLKYAQKIIFVSDSIAMRGVWGMYTSKDCVSMQKASKDEIELILRKVVLHMRKAGIDHILYCNNASNWDARVAEFLLREVSLHK